jgi:hypothetical protein
MTPTKASRGRPKGTGLNDAAQLQAIADLIAADPALKPTTAIKTLGITDPSIIRRLRDKYHLEADKLQTGLPVPSAHAQRPAPEPLRLVARETGVAPRSAALAVARPTKVSGIVDARARPRPVLVARVEAVEPPRTQSLRVAPTPAAIPSAAPPQDLTSAWVESGAAFIALSIEAHFAVLNSVFQWPPAIAVVQTQVAMSEFALAMASPFQFPSSRVS